MAFLPIFTHDLGFAGPGPIYAGTMASLPVYLSTASFAAALAASVPLQARADALADLVNAYRSAPGQCDGRAVAPAAPLAVEPALAQVRVGPGTFLESAIEQAGVRVDRAEAISVTGPADAQAALAAMRGQYCATLLDAGFSALGTARRGNTWQIVLAHPLVLAPLPDNDRAGQDILALVNDARARPRTCGATAFGPAAPLQWNGKLARAALAHSSELAMHHYFSHQERDGSQPGDRATRSGYAWTRIGENIASGQRSASEAVQSWLGSPGHCANIMNPAFTELGAAYAINPDTVNRTPYWTQEFGLPR